MKKNKLLICSLFMCMALAVLPGMKSNAEEITGETSAAETQDENSQRLEEITGLDENSNVVEIDASEGKVDESEAVSLFRSVGTQIVNFNTKSSKDVTYYTDTVTGTRGYTNGTYGADAAYLGTSDGKVKFMLSGVIGLVDQSEVQLVDFSAAKSISHYEVSGGKLYHYVTYNMTKSDYASKIYNGPAPSGLSEGTTYYSYDGHYFYTDYDAMLSDYRTGSRGYAVNAGNPFYNYFQYLPLRSQSSYDASALNSIINQKITSGSKLKDAGTFFAQYEDQYGVNALLALGVSANESAWGKSSICQEKNNLFGINAVDSSPGTSANTFATVEECIRQFMAHYMSGQYLDPNHEYYFGGFLGNKASGINVKYAADPYWGEKAAAIAWTLDSLGGSADNGKYSIAVKESSSTVNVRKEATTASASLYKTGSQLSHAVLVLNADAENGFYRIQSDAVLDADRNSVLSQNEYNFENMYAYISADYVTLVNTGSVSEPEPVTLTSITVTEAPDKTMYTEGETPDMSGMKVTAQWSDGTETDVTGDVSYSSDALAVGTTEILVSYTKDDVTVTASVSVTVNTAQTNEPTVNEPGTDEPTADEPGTDEPTVNEPGTDEPTADEPGTDEPTADEPGTDEPVVNEPNTDEPTVNEPSADEPTVDEPGTDESIVNEPTVNEPSVDKTAENEPAQDESSADKPAVNEPVKDETIVNESETEQSLENETTEDTVSAENEPSGNVTESTEVKYVETVLSDSQNGVNISGNISEGASMIVKPILKEGTDYGKYTKPLNGKTILGVFDITLNGQKDGKVSLSFTVDKKYNGKNVVILHYTDEDQYETFKTKVENGTVTINVDSFSPYVIALDSEGDIVPKTGDSADMMPWLLLGAAGILAAGAVIRRKRVCS